MGEICKLSKVEILIGFQRIQLLFIATLFVLSMTAQAQDRPSPTPMFVILTTPTPFVEQAVATVTPTFTPTPVGIVRLEVREESGSINVRTEPGPEADRLGEISFGTLYPVYRQFYSWYEIEFELSPNRRGWIYGEFVDIIGDPNEIEFIEDFNWATPQGPSGSSPTETSESGDGDASSTPVTRQIDAPIITESANVNETPSDQNPLPTFTYPPDTNSQSPVRSQVARNPNTDTSTNQRPPLLPILLLGGAGIVGILFDSLSR